MENETTAATPKAPAPQYVTVKVFYRAIIFVSIAMSILTVVVYHSFFTLKFVSFDMIAYTDQLKEARLANRITADQAEEMYKSVRTQIDALPPKYVVIAGDAILGNAPKLEKLNIR